MREILITAIAALFGGIVQAVTGFGGAIIIMIFLPSIYSMNVAPAVSDVITMTLSFSMFWRYRKSVKFRQIVVPAIFYLLASTIVIYQSVHWNTKNLKILFGVFLILLSVYFYLFSGRWHIRPSLMMNICCGTLAGVCGGLFGIGGPPVSLYYLTVTDTKEEYLGTINAFFSITVIFNIISRILNGTLTANLLPGACVGIAAILTGCVIGSRISHRIDLPVMKRCVYMLMLFAGIVSIIQVLN